MIRHQSECDFPHGTMRNGFINRTKCQAEERRGNSLLLLCIAQRLEGSEILQRGLQYSQLKWVKWLKFLKLYLSMEEWFHDSNNKVEVDNAKPLIGECWVKGLQLKTGSPVENYFKLWVLNFTKPNPCAHMLPVACGKQISNTRESLGNIMKSLSNIEISLS